MLTYRKAKTLSLSSTISPSKHRSETKKHNIRSLTIRYILLSIVSIIIFVISTLRLILQLIKYNTKKDSYLEIISNTTNGVDLSMKFISDDLSSERSY